MIKTIIRFISPQVLAVCKCPWRPKIPESLEKFPEKSAVTPRRVLHGYATTLTRPRGRRDAASVRAKNTLKISADGRGARGWEKGAEASDGTDRSWKRGVRVCVCIRTVGPVGQRDKVGI